MSKPVFKKFKAKAVKRVKKTIEERRAEGRGSATFKPMKPFTINDIHRDVAYPCWCTPKIDGVRGVTYPGGTPMSYQLKKIPNLHIRKTLEEYGVEGMDGELAIKGAKTFGESSGPIMRVKGEPDFIYYVFDMYQHEGLYLERIGEMGRLPKPRPPCIKLIKPVYVADAEGFMKFWNKCVDDGFEGVIARQQAVYLKGRSTQTVGGMGKYKNFQDDEAEIIGFEEMCTNTNPKKINAHGRSERGSAKAGKVPNGHMGKWLCRDLKTGIEFSCGTMKGVKMPQRKEFWDNRQIYIGWIIKYKHQPSGPTAKPRFPTFLGFRHKDDMETTPK
jgi:DNA ligase-1